MPPSKHNDERVQQFSSLLVANHRRIYGFILTLVHDRTAAEDIQQDVSAVLWQKFDTFEIGTDFAAWAMAVSRLTILNWRRKQKKVHLPLDDQQLVLLADEAVAVSCQYEARQAALDECLKKIDASGRELLASRFEMSQSVTSIAEQLGRSRVAIYKRLNRIQSLLLDCINERVSNGASTMNQPSESWETRLDELVAALRDDSLSDEQSVDLQNLLQTQPGARRRFAESMQLLAMLESTESMSVVGSLRDPTI